MAKGMKQIVVLVDGCSQHTCVSVCVCVCEFVEFCLQGKSKTPIMVACAKNYTKAKLLKFRHNVCEMGCIGRCADVLLCVVVAVPK